MRKPQIIPSVISLFVLVGLIQLGNWQMERLAWKEALIARVSERLDAPPEWVPNTRRWPELSSVQNAYKRVLFAGKFDYDKEIYWYAGAYRGETGVHVITPLQQLDGTYILVNRGFVPDRLKDPKTRAQGQLEGHHNLSGLMRWPSQRGMFEPENDTKNNLWFVRDLDQIADYLGLEVAPFFIELDADSGFEGGPIAGQTRVQFSNRHLEYAMTWYGLALTLVVIFILWHIVPQHRKPDDD